MNCDDKAYEYAEARSGEYFGCLPEQMFENGSKWQRDQLRTDEAVEIAAQAIYAEERRVVDPAWPVWEDPRNGEARESTREAVRHMLTALLGDSDND